jgi:rhodanese-related sulfurtransferase
MIVVGGLLPLLLYWLFFSRVPTVTPTRAKELLRSDADSAVLVDIRSADQFNLRHIDGAGSWPAEDILRTASANDIPEQYKGKTLLLVDDAGITGHSAARHLADMAPEAVMYVRGGIQEWIASVNAPEGELFDRFITHSDKVEEFPFRPMSWHLQLLAVIVGFVVKPVYMGITLLAAVLLWRSRARDLVALRWSVIFFLIGETLCVVYYVLFDHASYLLEYLHSFGMVLSFGFATYAILEGMDIRILRLSDPNKRCAVLDLCGKCIKYENVQCGLQRLFLLLIVALAIVALMPLNSDWHYSSYNTKIFGTFYSYLHRVIYQQYERVFCPIVSAVLLTVSLLILAFKKERPLPLAKLLLAAGIGPMGFGLLRTVLAGLYSQNKMWFDFWEETTELLFVAGICYVLWIFRQQLLQRPTRKNMESAQS